MRGKSKNTIFGIIIILVVIGIITIMIINKQKETLEEQKKADIEADNILKIESIMLEYNAINPYDKLKEFASGEYFWDYYTFLYVYMNLKGV